MINNVLQLNYKAMKWQKAFAIAWAFAYAQLNEEPWTERGNRR